MFRASEKYFFRRTNAYMMNTVGEFLCFQTEGPMLQVVNAAFADDRFVIVRPLAGRKNLVFGRNTDLLKFRCQNPVDFVVVFADKG